METIKNIEELLIRVESEFPEYYRASIQLVLGQAQVIGHKAQDWESDEEEELGTIAEVAQLFNIKL